MSGSSINTAAAAKKREAAKQEARHEAALDSMGITPEEVKGLRKKARSYLKDPQFHKLRADVKENTLLVILMDGLLGTEPWRNAGAGPHAAGLAQDARLRYVKLASALLEQLEKVAPKEEKKLLEGVIDAEVVK